MPACELPVDAIAELCRTYHVRTLELFGSAARGDFDEKTSDFDFFVEFAEGTGGLFDQYFPLKEGLETLLHRKVDLVERSAVANRHFLEMANEHRRLVFADR